MEMPRPGEAHRRLHRLAGIWEGAEEMHGLPPGQGGAFQGRHHHRVDVGGLYLLGDYQQQRDGKPSFQGHSVFGVDSGSGEVCRYWFDALGMVPAGPSRGAWNGDELVLLARFPQGVGRYRYTLEGEDRFRFQLESSLDGESYRTVMIGRYRKTA
jgi:hypothetical protein